MVLANYSWKYSSISKVLNLIPKEIPAGAGNGSTSRNTKSIVAGSSRAGYIGVCGHIYSSMRTQVCNKLLFFSLLLFLVTSTSANSLWKYMRRSPGVQDLTDTQVPHDHVLLRPFAHSDPQFLHARPPLLQFKLCGKVPISNLCDKLNFNLCGKFPSHPDSANHLRMSKVASALASTDMYKFTCT